MAATRGHRNPIHSVSVEIEFNHLQESLHQER